MTDKPFLEDFDEKEILIFIGLVYSDSKEETYFNCLEIDAYSLLFSNINNPKTEAAAKDFFSRFLQFHNNSNKN